uniref:Histidinol-phosphate aminotransferase n=1 Tax=Anthurium amnicola TaxID=1678845 RepID=A0A1D1Z3P7_9ARAE
MATATASALGGKAFLSGEDGLSGRRVRLHRSRTYLVGDSRRRGTVRTAALAAAAGPAPHAVARVVPSAPFCVDPFAQTASGYLRGRSRRGGDAGGDPVSPEKLDEWMRDSVTEIVRNIGEAPFLVHVFSNSSKGGDGGRLRLEREGAHAESWPHIRRRWSTGAALPPDGVILVEELKGEESAAGSEEDGSSKIWGLVVQGRGGVGGAACYILNTCRVRSSFGFCTHFCLARAKCFGDTADVQLKKAWLVHHDQQQCAHC